VILQRQPRDRVSLSCAATQNNLGNALKVLGERESETAHLEQAVAAYHAALEEYTRDRVPLDWAATQSNFGHPLEKLGERESGTAHLEQAVLPTTRRWRNTPVIGCRSIGPRRSTTSALHSRGLANARAGRHTWRRRSPPIVWR
jgi:Tetratricopeptide repeat